MWTIASSYEQARRNAETGAAQIRKMADFRLSLYEKQCPGLSREEIGRMLDRSNRQRLDAVPDLKKYPELRGMRDLLEAEWRGVRDGARLTPEQSAVTHDGDAAYWAGADKRRALMNELLDEARVPKGALS